MIFLICILYSVFRLNSDTHGHVNTFICVICAYLNSGKWILFPSFLYSVMFFNETHNFITVIHEFNHQTKSSANVFLRSFDNRGKLCKFSHKKFHNVHKSIQ